MKTRISIYSVLVLAALAISAVSCNRMIDEFDAGGPIRFSAGTEYDNGPFTRTEYSGIVSGTSTLKERINWVKNDPITINYKQEGESSFQTGKYKIKDGTITTSGASSVASIEPVTDELYWGENSSKSHVFYAMYPSKGFGGNNKADLVGNTVSGYIPDTQVPTKSGNKYIADMKYAYMVAMATVGYTLPPSVQLPFCPAFTAFHFEINSDNSAAITVSKFELEADTNLAGEFSFDITGGNASGATWTASSTTVTNGVKKITVDLDLTVLALPIQQSGLKITLTTSNGPKVLRLNDASNNPVVFAPCKKYTISNNTLPGGESWTYTVGPIEDIKVYGHKAVSGLAVSGSDGNGVKSYKTNDQNGTTAAVAWTVEYATSPTGPFYSTPAAAGISDRFSVTPTTTNGGTAGEATSAAILRDHIKASECNDYGSFQTESAAIAALRSRTHLPSTTSDAGDGYFDLSKHYIYDDEDNGIAIDGDEIAMETANCYVVRAPGKYKFPTVYGNGIRNGATNEKAYAPQGLSVSNDIGYYMRRFLRHDNQPIGGPWIFSSANLGTYSSSAYNAIVVWQDVISVNYQILLADDLDISSDGSYIRFEIKEENIRPGNIVIALRNGSTIVWSWHIWVTDKNLKPIRVGSKMTDLPEFGGVDYSDLLPYNLGWIDDEEAGGIKWDDWTFYVKIKQTEAGGTERIFKVEQIGDSESVDYNVGTSTFYQWGRKDPFLPANSPDGLDEHMYNRHYYSAYYTITEDAGHGPACKTVGITNGTLAVGHSIQNPYIIYHNTVTRNYLSGNDGNAGFCNLWDANMITYRSGGTTYGPSGASNAYENMRRRPLKTVYDPCPRGCVVPWAFVFTGFSEKEYNFVGWANVVGTQEHGGYMMDRGPIHIPRQAVSRGMIIMLRITPSICSLPPITESRASSISTRKALTRSALRSRPTSTCNVIAND